MLLLVSKVLRTLRQEIKIFILRDLSESGWRALSNHNSLRKSLHLNNILCIVLHFHSDAFENLEDIHDLDFGL